jgi:transcriptional regulator with GAF, ATPase, and Fis domain
MDRRSAEARKTRHERLGPETPPGASPRDLFEVYLRRDFLSGATTLKQALDGLERDIIVNVLEMTRGNQNNAAKILGIKPTTLHYKLRRLGVSRVHRIDTDVLPPTPLTPSGAVSREPADLKK